MLKKWDNLPEFMRCDEVRPYWESLNRKRGQLIIKRIFDIVMAVILLVLLAIPMLVLAVWIKADSDGPVFYRQERVTTYGKHFRIHKFRTMVSNAEQIGTAVTVGNDSRITKVGSNSEVIVWMNFPSYWMCWQAPCLLWVHDRKQ